MFKVIIFVSVFITTAYSLLEVPAITSQHQNILRSYGNLGQVSTYSKTLDTPFSSVRKSDVRVSNPGYAIPAPYPLAHAVAPALPALPAYAGLHGPIVGPGPYISPVAKAVAPAGLLGVAYSPATAVAHMTYTNGLGLSYQW